MTHHRRATGPGARHLLAAGLAVITGLGPLAAQSTGAKRQVELGTYGTVTRYDGGSIALTNQFGAGGRLAYFLTNTFSIEASGDYTQTDALSTGATVNVTRLGGTFYAQRKLVGSQAFYLGAGYERLFYRAGRTFDDNGVHLAIGNRLPLGGRAMLRVEGRAAYFPNSPAQVAGDRVMNFSASAGLSIFGFGGPPRDEDRDGVRDRDDDCAATPFGAMVDQVGCPTDQDTDGVFDGLDACADTPVGATVDQTGCPADEDSDTVFNGIDQCPATPLGATVDQAGCPGDDDDDGIFNGIDLCPDTPQGALTDSSGCPLDGDGDGVYNGLDRCPATPAGTVVDEFGCPADTDLDGVLNDVDQCPNTPLGAEVDETGCPPRDSDRDGIPDGVDRCPSTAPGQEVDAFGCPILFVEEAGEVQPLVLKGVHFATGKSRLTAASFEILNDVAQSLKNYPDVRIEVAGHTDATGSLRTNQRLSQARAEAVMAYLARQGIDPTRMEARGYGPDQPIATNGTREGRAQNRRVELRRLN